MAMTEKQGGTDVRANTTRAWPWALRAGRGVRARGHKWFCSAPMCDAFLTLAYTDKGLSCFLLPRHRPDGTRNQLYVQRLKNKLGNWSNASAEVEYRGALAWMVGEEGRGVPTIIEMVALTRFDCMIGSSALMRQALTQAAHHCAYRQVSGRVLVEQPLMQNVLADLALESEAALALTLRLARALDHAHDEQEEKFARLATAIGKYWICKRAPAMINEAQECLGGAGYVEDTLLPRLYREAPVNSIWEGAGNVQCSTYCAHSRASGRVGSAVHRVGRWPWRCPARGAHRASSKILPTPATSSIAHAGSPRTWPSRCRPGYSSKRATRRCPMPSSGAGWARPDVSTVRCRTASM
jgi:putative acyl-CoA dehydrogenase